MSHDLARSLILAHSHSFTQAGHTEQTQHSRALYAVSNVSMCCRCCCCCCCFSSVECPLDYVSFSFMQRMRSINVSHSHRSFCLQNRISTDDRPTNHTHIETVSESVWPTGWQRNIQATTQRECVVFKSSTLAYTKPTTTQTGTLNTHTFTDTHTYMDTHQQSNRRLLCRCNAKCDFALVNDVGFFLSCFVRR